MQAMRLAFLVLLLANVVIFAWGHGGRQGLHDAREPERMQHQVAPEQLRILRGTAVADAAPVPACQRIQWLTAAEAEALRAAVGDRPGWQFVQSPREAPPAHWVVIGGLSGRPLAERKIAELRKLGVNEGEIVADEALGPFAISLGVFRSRQAAEAHLQALAKKKVRSARLAQRALPPEQFTVDLRAPAGALAVRLAELQALFAQAEFIDCADR